MQTSPISFVSACNKGNRRRLHAGKNPWRNVPKILDLKSSSEQIFSENCRWVPLVLGHAFINSKLDFCNSLLHGLPKNEFNKLQSIQNAEACVIACLRYFDHIRRDTLKELYWLPVE